MGTLDRTSFLDTTASLSVTIASGGSLSSLVDLGGMTLIGIHMPSTWTTANLTFQGSEDGSSFDNIYDASGNEKTVTAAASRFIYLAPLDWIGFRYLKVRSGTAGSAVNQGADRIVVLQLRPNLG